MAPTLVRLFSVAIVLLLVGCRDTTPTSVALQVSGLVTTSAKGTPLVIRVGNQKGEELRELAAQAVVTVEPPSLAVVANGNAELRCIKSGTVKVTAKIGALTQSADVRCLLIRRVAVAPLPRQVVGRAAQIQFQVFDDSDAAIPEPPCTIESSADGVAAVSGTALAPKSVGQARITVRCPDVSDHVDVSVAEVFTTKTFTLKDGDRTAVEVPEGLFEATIETKGDPLDVSWVGGTGCGSDSGTLRSVTTCRVASAGKLQVVNPAVKTTQGLIGGVLGAVFGSSSDPNAGVSDGIIAVLRIPDERAAPSGSAKPVARPQAAAVAIVEGEKSPRVEAIRGRYQAVGAAQRTLSKVEKAIFGMSTEGASLIGYFDGGTLRKAEWTILGEGGKQVRELMFHEGHLEFAFIKTTAGGTGGPGWTDSEERYYLANGDIIWATRGKSRDAMNASDIASARSDLRQMEAQVLEALKAKAAELWFEDGKLGPMRK